jgi:uncharacterized protein with HEPN domain
MPGDEAWLADMLAAARHALSHTAEMSRETFLADLRTQHAVEMQIVIIGEAAGKVSDIARAAIADVPFRDVVRMRNRLVHHYFKVDLDLVWDVVQVDLTVLATAIEGYLSRSPPSGGIDSESTDC